VSLAFKRRWQPSRREELTTRLAQHDALVGGIEDPVKRARAEGFAAELRSELGAMRAKRSPSTKPAGPSEHQEQCAVIAWWRLAHSCYALPEWALAAIPNGGARDMITGARLKAEGVRRGMPDLLLASARGDYHGLFIELKVGSNKPSSEQIAFMDHLNHAGYRAVVHWSADDAIAEIKAYLS
jgi:hypothetical protein